MKNVKILRCKYDNIPILFDGKKYYHPDVIVSLRCPDPIPKESE